ADGAVYDGEWKEGEMHGRGKMTYASGAVYDGERKKGKRHGRGKMTYADGEVYDGEFKNGLRHGDGISVYPDGSEYKVEYYLNQSIKSTSEKKGTGLHRFMITANSKNGQVTSQDISLKWIEESMRESSNENSASDPVYRKIQKSIESVSFCAKLHDPKERDRVIRNSEVTPQIILGGMRNHAISFVFYGKNVFICNSGLGSSEVGDEVKQHEGKGRRVQAILHLICQPRAVDSILRIINLVRNFESKKGLRMIYQGIKALENVSVCKDSRFPLKGVRQRGPTCAFRAPCFALKMAGCLETDKQLKNKLKRTPTQDEIKEDFEGRPGGIYHLISKKNMRKISCEYYIQTKLNIDPNYSPINDTDVFGCDLSIKSEDDKIIEKKILDLMIKIWTKLRKTTSTIVESIKPLSSGSVVFSKPAINLILDLCKDDYNQLLAKMMNLLETGDLGQKVFALKIYQELSARMDCQEKLIKHPFFKSGINDLLNHDDIDVKKAGLKMLHDIFDNEMNHSILVKNDQLIPILTSILKSKDDFLRNDSLFMIYNLSSIKASYKLFSKQPELLRCLIDEMASENIGFKQRAELTFNELFFNSELCRESFCSLANLRSSLVKLDGQESIWNQGLASRALMELSKVNDSI
ncbi:MAG: hypothetical protein HRT90_09115, partial [Candidatus Margulisbacteria bacterium]|nr:hypothetical protein [Candidatus Margulisiibacteriota bacterium]